MTAGPWLIDKSALVRLGSSRDWAEWNPLIERGLVRITTVTLLEVGYSARSAADHDVAVSQPPVTLMPVEYLTPAAGAQSRFSVSLQHVASTGRRPYLT